jgi:hypothetical protein
MNNIGAPQGDELGRKNPFDCNSAICFFSSASSFTAILYDLIEIGGVLGSKSIINSMSRSGGVPGKFDYVGKLKKSLYGLKESPK